ncbi:MAG: Mrp/NBP35 family ATP-binding protein [Alistipes sp.]|nr:Mrp/NBP35 family ATP-binding protein [Alistipes sp.]
MTRKERVLALLDGVIHPETGEGLAKSGFVESVSAESGRQIDIVLKFKRERDPFGASLRRQVVEAVSSGFSGESVSVEIASPKAMAAEPSKHLPGVKKVVAIASGKGGVGKSTVTANLAATLAARGFRVGVLDADIYGPSQPELFGVTDYVPVSEGPEDSAAIVPAESGGVKIMSIGFFISPSDALVWRGPMAVNALRQLIRQTVWGELDWLLVDLPPGTGDVHLSVVHELAIDGAIIVSTPQSLALADVRRGVEMFRAEGIDVPVLGIVENMAWFSPAEYPDYKYFIFGHRGVERFAEEMGLEVLGAIPIVMGEGENGTAAAVGAPSVSACYEEIASRVVEKLANNC